MTVPEENVFARDMAWRLFRDAADTDYLVARWCLFVGMYYQFSWNAQQAIEKYLKCHLILNDRDVSAFGHDLESLWVSALEVADDLLPTLLCPPNYFPSNIQIVRRRFEPTADFVARLNNSGSVDQRYRYYSISTERYDLHKLDELVFVLRRICFPLDMEYSPQAGTYRDALSSQRLLQPHPRFHFEEMTSKMGRDDRLEIFQRANFAFAEDVAIDRGGIEAQFSATNSPIFMALQSGAADRLEALRWFLRNARFSREVRRQLIDEVQRIEDENGAHDD